MCTKKCAVNWRNKRWNDCFHFSVDLLLFEYGNVAFEFACTVCKIP